MPAVFTADWQRVSKPVEDTSPVGAMLCDSAATEGPAKLDSTLESRLAEDPATRRRGGRAERIPEWST
jgi:hypothetical protein